MFKFKKHFLLFGLIISATVSVNAMQTKEKTRDIPLDFLGGSSTRDAMLVPVSPSFVANIRSHTPVHTSSVLQPNLVCLRKFSVLGKYLIKPDFWYHDGDGTLFMGVYGKESIINFHRKLSEYVSVKGVDTKLKEFHSQFESFLTSAYLGNMKEISIIFNENLSPVAEKSSAPIRHYFNLSRKYGTANSAETYRERAIAIESVFLCSLQDLIANRTITRDSVDFKKIVLFSTVEANRHLLTYLEQYENLDTLGKTALKSLQEKINAIILCHGTKFCVGKKPLVGVTVSRCKMLQGKPQDEIESVQNEKMIIVFIPNDVIPEFRTALVQNADKDYSNITGQHRFQMASPDELTRLVSHLNPDNWQSDIDVLSEYKRFLEAEKSHRENVAKSSFAKFGISMAGNVLKLVSKAAAAYASGGATLVIDSVGQSDQTDTSSSRTSTETEQTFSLSDFETAKREKDALKELVAEDNTERELQKQIDEINETQMRGTGLMVRKNPFAEPTRSDARPKAQLVSGCAKALRKALPKPEDVDELFAGFDHLVEAERIKGSIESYDLRLQNAREAKKYEENFVNSIKLLIQLMRSQAEHRDTSSMLGLLITEDRSGVVQNQVDQVGTASRIKYTVYPVPKLVGFELQ